MHSLRADSPAVKSYFPDNDPLRPGPPVDADGILLIAEDDGLSPDPLDLDPITCRCGGAMWRFEGEDYCPLCLRFEPTPPRNA